MAAVQPDFLKLFRKHFKSIGLRVKYRFRPGANVLLDVAFL